MDLATPCILYQGARNKAGYGVMPKPIDGSRLAHRAALAEYLGWPVEAHALHHCDNPPCINPEHLYDGSYLDNNEDKVTRGRARGGRYNQTHCKYGHELTSENVTTYVRESTRSTITARRCMTCRRDDNKKQSQRRKDARHSRGLRKSGRPSHGE